MKIKLVLSFAFVSIVVGCLVGWLPVIGPILAGIVLAEALPLPRYPRDVSMFLTKMTVIMVFYLVGQSLVVILIVPGEMMVKFLLVSVQAVVFEAAWLVTLLVRAAKKIRTLRA